MGLHNIFLVMRQEIYATMRRMSFVLLAFVLPVVLGLVAIGMYLLGGDTPEEEAAAPEKELARVLGYVDPADWIKVLPPESPAGRFVEFDAEGPAQTALENGEIDGYFLLPADYLVTGSLTYVVLEFDLSEDIPSPLMFEQLVALNLLGEDLELGLAALEPIVVESVQVLSPGAAAGEDNWMAEMLPFFLVLILYFVILIPASSLVASITDEKKNRVLEILLSSVSAGQFFVGKLLALGILGLVQTLIWVGTMWGVAKYGGQPLNLPEGYGIPAGLLVWAVVYSLLGYAMYGTQMAGIGALAPTMNDTRSLTMIVLAPLIIGYMLNPIVTEAPESALAVGLSLFPLTAPIVMIGRMAQIDLPLWQPLLSLILQLLAVVWIVRVFTRLFRAQALLSGQELTVRSLFKALRTP